MKFKETLAAVALITLGVVAVNSPAKADDDPGPGYYQNALKGKRVVMVPMAMGFDLAQGWAAYLKREVEGWGGKVEALPLVAGQSTTGVIERVLHGLDSKKS